MGSFKLADIFTNNMILQRDSEICIYGSAPDGCLITVQIGEHTGSAVSVNGSWKVILPPLPAGSIYELNVSDDNGERMTIHNLQCGDVWIAGGQSNMELNLNFTDNPLEVQKCPDLDGVYLYTVPRYSYADEWKADIKQKYPAAECWVPCKGDDAFMFSAVGYYFARRLSKDIDVPIGLINCNWGATTLLNWMPESLAVRMPSYGKIINEYKDLVSNIAHEEYEARFAHYLGNIEKDPIPPYGPKSFLRPCGLYETMLSKIIDFRTKGILWYQGESDVIERRADVYKDALAMFHDFLREKSNNRHYCFLNVQLVPFGDSWIPDEGHWPAVCQAQLERAYEDPDYAMVTTGDCGDVNIHPVKKKEIGERLALAALHKAYGQNIEYCGPTPKRAYCIDNSVTIKFSHTREIICRDMDPATFEIAGMDGVFYRSGSMQISDVSVTVLSENVDNPQKVRYAWKNFYRSNIFNEEGFPASPFTVHLPFDGTWNRR